MMKNSFIIKKSWILDQHRNTNHLYDNYLPYEFHLRMVVNVFNRFAHLLDDEKDYFTDSTSIIDESGQMKITLRNASEVACWGHDLIEYTRVTYNDVKDALGQEAVEIIYAVTNEKGKTRKERANSKYYSGIRETKGAVFVKLCDRIANVEYSKMTGSRMFEMYKKENYDFLVGLGYMSNKPLSNYLNSESIKAHEYQEVFQYLIGLFD